MTRDGGGWTLGLKSWYQAGGLFGNTAAVGVVTDATTLKGNAYKLSDGVIRNLIGPAQNFDVMADQAGWNSGYSSGNYEYVIARNYTGYWRFDTRVAASSTTTSFQSYRLSDNALAWTGNWQCGNVGGWGINCYNMLSGNPQGGAGCNINMGYQSNAGWHHFYMGETNTDTYLYVCNGPQHSSSYNMNHRWWFRERTVSSTGTTVQGKLGKARQFNGGSDYVSVADSTGTRLTTGFTLETWINPTNLTSYMQLISKFPWTTDYAYQMNTTNTGKLRIDVSTNGTTYANLVSSTPLTAGIWQHVAATWDGSIIKLFINGVQDYATLPFTGPLFQASTTMDIGRVSGSNNQMFNGLLDEVRVSSVARTPSEIRQAYEISRRTHPITIDFVNSLNASDLIAASSDLSFAVNDATSLYLGDKVIIKEQLEGVQFVAQATVNTKVGNTITVASWDTGSTFPSSGYSTNATVIKWQKEYFDLGGIASDQRNAVTKVTMKATSNIGANVWFDDLKTNLYLNDTAPDSFNTQTGIGTYSVSIPQSRSQYFQYRAVLNSSDPNTSPSLNSARLDYINNTTPPAPHHLLPC